MAFINKYSKHIKLPSEYQRYQIRQLMFVCRIQCQAYTNQEQHLLKQQIRFIVAIENEVYISNPLRNKRKH